MASGVSFFTLSVPIGAGVTAAVESLAFLEGDMWTVFTPIVGVRTPVETGSDMLAQALVRDALYTRPDAKGRQLRRLKPATMSRFTSSQQQALEFGKKG